MTGHSISRPFFKNFYLPVDCLHNQFHKMGQENMQKIYYCTRPEVATWKTTNQLMGLASKYKHVFRQTKVLPQMGQSSRRIDQQPKQCQSCMLYTIQLKFGHIISYTCRTYYFRCFLQYKKKSGMRKNAGLKRIVYHRLLRCMEVRSCQQHPLRT